MTSAGTIAQHRMCYKNLWNCVLRDTKCRQPNSYILYIDDATCFDLKDRLQTNCMKYTKGNIYNFMHLYIIIYMAFIFFYVLYTSGLKMTF
jgi:hypothetical protein